MKHFGDITKINGYTVPIVDVITGGSPCQDLSVAGKRAGLAGERSGLFMEQMRLVKEMREHDRLENGRPDQLVRPRFMVWENVPGAFSSGNPKGADFAAVIEEIIKVAEPDSVVSVCVPDGGWTKSGCYYAEDGSWSIAWRVHDAQFWGVPQRRKRIALVADFGGLAAPEILFERKGLSRDSESSREARQGSAAGAQGGAARAVAFMGGQGSKAGSIAYGEELSPSIKSAPSGGNTVPDVMMPRAVSIQGNVVDRDAKQHGGGVAYECSFTINATDRHAVAAVDCRNGAENECVTGTLQAKENGGTSLNLNNVVRVSN